MRLALLPAALLVLAAPAAAQQPDALAGTWYSLQSSRLVLGPAADSTSTPIEASTLVTLELAVDGGAVTGQERRAITLPPGAQPGQKDPVTMTAERAVTGTLEGGLLRLRMTSGRGDALAYDATLADDGRLAVRYLPDAPAPDVEIPTLLFERQPPKPRAEKD